MDQEDPATYHTDRKLKNVLKAIDDLKKINPRFAEGYQLQDEERPVLGRRQHGYGNYEFFPANGRIILEEPENITIDGVNRYVEQIRFNHHLHAKATHFLSSKLRNSDHPITPLKYHANLKRVEQLYNEKQTFEPDDLPHHDHTSIAHALTHTNDPAPL